MRVRRPVALGAFVVVLAACGGDDQSAEGNTTINYTFDWKCQGDWAPALLAQKNGYFSDENLEVNFTEGDGGSTALVLIASGEQDMGQISAAPVVLGLGQDYPVTAVGVQMSKNPVVIIADGEIESPKDLEGHTLFAQEDQFEGAIWEAWAADNGVDTDKVESVPARADYLTQFVGRKLDAMVGFYPANATWEMTEQREGDEHIFFMDESLPTYGHATVVNNSFLEDNPEAVRGFLRAWAKGMEYAIQNPDESVELVLDECPVNEPEPLAFSLEAYTDFWASPQAEKDGLLSFTGAGWEATKDVLVGAGFMDDVDVSELYSTDYLPEEPVRP